MIKLDDWKRLTDKLVSYQDHLIWTGGLAGGTNPYMKLDGKSQSVAKLYYEHENDIKITKPAMVFHTCKYSRCVAHLEVRTPSRDKFSGKNMTDRIPRQYPEVAPFRNNEPKEEDLYRYIQRIPKDLVVEDWMLTLIELDDREASLGEMSKILRKSTSKILLTLASLRLYVYP